MSKIQIFKIEEFSPLRVNPQGKLRYVYDFKELRRNNKELGNPLNSGLPIFQEEKELMKKMVLEDRTLGELLDYFQRPQNSIKKILKGIPIKYPKDFFKIEETRSFKGSLNDLLNKRKENKKNNRCLNSYFPHYPEEKTLVKKMYFEGKTIGNLVDYFQRHEKSILFFLDLGKTFEKEQKVKSNHFTKKVPKVNKEDYKFFPKTSEKHVREFLDLKIDVSRLTDRELFVLKSRWGLGLRQPLTLQEVGVLMELTRERVRQIEMKCYRKISFKEK